MKKLPFSGARRGGGMALILLIPLLLLTGCFPTALPNQQNPSCSWDSTPPADSSGICQTTFRTLRDVVNAEVRGDNATIHRLVTNAAVARHVIAYGATLRANGNPSLHVDASLTLAAGPHPNDLIAGLYLIGKTRRGQISALETVYLRLHHGTAYLVGDQPLEEW